MEEKDRGRRYVSRLLLDMIRKGTLCQTLRQSEQLPLLNMEQSAIPSFVDVARRLKTMCDLEPRQYPEPVDGRIRVMTLQGKDAHFWVHFSDIGPDPSVDVRLVPGVQPG